MRMSHSLSSSRERREYGTFGYKRKCVAFMKKFCGIVWVKHGMNFANGNSGEREARVTLDKKTL